MTAPLRLSFVQWQLGLLGSEDLPAVATAVLERGVDSPSLRILAGLSRPTASEASPIVDGVAEELRLDLPVSNRDAVLLAARGIAERIVSGEIPAYEGARRIWSLWNDDDYPDELLPFVGEASQIDDYLAERVKDPDRYDAWIAAAQAGIVDAARELVRTVAA